MHKASDLLSNAKGVRVVELVSEWAALQARKLQENLHDIPMIPDCMTSTADMLWNGLIGL